MKWEILMMADCPMDKGETNETNNLLFKIFQETNYNNY